MHLIRNGKFERTDMWREGKWLDLWSVGHLLSGVSVGLAFYLLPFGNGASVVIAVLGFISYEMWEKIVGIEEASTNRCMDVVVGVVSFLPVFFLLAPLLPETPFILTFGFVLTANIVMSVFGWIASQKAAALQERLRARYARHRVRLLEKRALREKSRRNRLP